VEVLKNISLNIEEESFVAIMGPSGAGKSTLLHILGLIDSPSSGELYLKGKNTKDIGERERAMFRNRLIGFVFQAHYLLPEFSTLENVAMPLLISGEKPKEAKSKAKSMLERVGLSSRMDHKPSEISGGEQQRAAVARALINEPSLLLADEPTGNLDRETGLTLITLLSSLHREKKMTVVMVTHDPQLAAMAQRTLKLVDGVLKDA
jgi:lipoprotein-releasing system ATP-binding protein